MKKSLIRGFSKEETPEIRGAFVDAHRFRKHLTLVLRREVESLQVSMRNEDNFDSPNWAFIQADKVAQTKALLKVIGMLNEERD